METLNALLPLISVGTLELVVVVVVGDGCFGATQALINRQKQQCDVHKKATLATAINSIQQHPILIRLQ